ACGGAPPVSPEKKTAETIQREVTHEVDQLLRVIFSARRKTGHFDLQAIEMAVRSAMLLAGRAPAEYPVPLPFARGNTKGRSPRVRSRRGSSASKQRDRDVPLSSQSGVQLYIHGCGMGSRQ